ncbi:unnamed protein product [Rotaria socialis]|uniref:Peptidase C1A papain C-terminal domain-containing protein n=2 Tax=Rotaria socialis TaxID=392032 RepID=A0A818R4Q9_9BILA|nr:unnamed protein product [Rotaria socialis]
MTMKTYLLNRITGRKFRLNGIRPSTRLPHKQRLRQSFQNFIVYSADQLPPKVDLRSHMLPIEDQSQIGSCAANCLVGVYQYLNKQENEENIAFSPLFLYYNGRAKENPSGITDSSCTMTNTVEALEESGVCLESIWPYNISQLNTKPSAEIYSDAKGHKIIDALQVDVDLTEMKSCLAQGFPFVFGLKLFPSFDKAGKTGVVSMPNSNDESQPSENNHALLAVGYSDKSQSFIVRNSWGEDWGDKGYCYIPYKYVTNIDYCFDVWTVRQLATDDYGQDHWDNTDSVDYQQSKNSDDENNKDDNHVIQNIDEDDDKDVTAK